MKKLPKEMMEYWNSILVVNNCILKISSYEKSKIIFNNGLIIEGKNDIQNFTRRLKKYVLYIDDLYNSDITIRKNTIKTIKSLGCRSGGQMNVKLHKEEMIRNIHSVSPWHKGSKGLIKIWNKGLTKDNDERIKKYVISIVFETREPKDKSVSQLIDVGASPRASIFLILAGRIRAFMEGRNFVTPEDIKEVAYPVLRHRIIPSFEAEAEKISTDRIIGELLNRVEVP